MSRECAVVRGGSGKAPHLRDAGIETQLVEIQRRTLEARTPPVEELAYPPPAKKAANGAALPVVDDVYVSNDKKGRYVRVLNVTDEHVDVVTCTEGKRATKAKIEIAVFMASGTKGFTFDRHEAIEDAPPAKKGKPDKDDNARYRPLSQRRGVLPKGASEYKLREDGKRWRRAPQGSAAELARLPVGTVREREWQGHIFRVKKIQDGEVVDMGEGKKRKRDGKWKLFEILKVIETKETKRGKKGEPPVTTVKKKRGPKVQKAGDIILGNEACVGSANQLAFFITGNRAWSGARFFQVLPPHLDPKSDKYAPERFKPGSLGVYRFGEKEETA